MKELNFYFNREKGILDLVICSFVFILLVFLIGDLDSFNENLFRNCAFVFVIVLIFFFLIYIVVGLLRKKTLLTITKNEIIIYRVFLKPIIVKFSDVKSFQILTSYQIGTGIPTSNQIVIELKKPTEKYSKT